MKKATTKKHEIISISKGNIKMGGIPSFSLLPLVTCSKDACRTCGKEGCYAVKLCRIYKTTRAAYTRNTELAMNDIPTLEKELEKYFSSPAAPRLFRIHVSGDFFSAEYAEMWVRIARKFKGTGFLAFTKQWDIIRNLDLTGAENLVIRCSDWPTAPVPADLQEKFPCAYVQTKTDGPEKFDGMYHCQGDCENCAECWNVRGNVVFKKH